ncbi:MAG: prolipoprotein diacylglyceryl transferase [Defluviitaleaceae bacterium]|nr:prolipoprotein diacylglyceryl transferase [Defluviitaleaceae bacterium]MCL2274668.1 prolipoprotein diacylglyceryl transferase [Defluviitaleaceae bacterium]MCL2275771.1 prolipoprotein diacylglyceryl transferase [Defluviitaleaceae bacterium]
MPPDHVTPEIWFPNLGFYFERVPQHALNVGGFAIYWYAVIIVFGIAMAALLAFWWAGKTGQNVDHYYELLLVGLVFAFIGLRTYFVVFNWDAFRGRPWFEIAFDIRGGGLAIYGGIIGAALAAMFISWRRRVPFFLLADTGAPSMLLGQIIGRFGNFFNAEAFGSYTDNLFAMRIRVDRAAYTTPDLLERAVHANGATYIQVHPTFFYEAAFNLVWMLILLFYRPHKRFDGEILWLYFLGYGVARFFIEGLRTDQLKFFGTGLAASQVVSVAFVAVSLTALILGYLQARKPAPTKKRRRR